MTLAVSKDALCFVKQRENQIVLTIGSSIGGKDRPILFIYANRFKGIETGF